VVVMVLLLLLIEIIIIIIIKVYELDSDTIYVYGSNPPQYKKVSKTHMSCEKRNAQSDGRLSSVYNIL
jgi:hypothetical protein